MIPDHGRALRYLSRIPIATSAHRRIRFGVPGHSRPMITVCREDNASRVTHLPNDVMTAGIARHLRRDSIMVSCWRS